MTHVIPGEWKSNLGDTHVCSPNIYLDHHVIKKVLL